MAKRKPKKRPGLIDSPIKKVGLVTLALLIIAGLIYLVFFHNSNPPISGGAKTTTADGKKVNLSPPTTNDKQSNDANKEAIVNRDNNLSNPSQPTIPASVIITEATSTSVKAYVQGVYEDGGNCSATATQGTQVITAASIGFKNVSYTQCAPLNWQRALGAGTWSIKLTYKSGDAEASATKTVQL